MTQVTHYPIVSPYRFTHRAAELIAFYEMLGLTTIVRQGDYAVLAARSGRVAVHPLETAQSTPEESTSLVFAVPDAAVEADRLAAAGIDAEWWDESFGRMAEVRTPAGTFTLEGELDDTYGHDEVEPRHPAPVDVVATVATGHPDELAAALGVMGLEASSIGLTAGPNSGEIRLQNAPATDSITTTFEFATAEPLESLAERVEASGASVGRTRGALHTIDPGGMPLVISSML